MAQNGRLPASDLAPIHQGRLARQAAAAWNSLNVEARRLGTELRPTGSRSSYRDFATQQQMWDSPRYNAARPGTSNHGWGRAVDVPTVQMQNVIARIGAKYGWRRQGSTDPWHHEYVGGFTGRDPGPTGQAQPAAPQPKPEEREEEFHVRLAIGYEADGRVHLARIEGTGGNNQIHRRWMQRDGKWSAWFRQGAAEGRNRAWVSVQFARHPDGRLELFAMMEGDALWRVHQQAPNGNWAAQFVRA